ncbi:MOSC domain-containing protein [Alsobacter soli]|uniref:MOSC domain-containing protein n=1 Tax=Alsobacter soli TaxID=2109933 RepID=A0A2T1HTR1_9HYPH|nr:MOSC domain-containing protein [Alsobacter soli]PSC05024.1 MOSC domain-containing protein [Alsobacter soli]
MSGQPNLGSRTHDRANLAAIYRYPVKGLSPEKLERVALTVGDPLPHDRRYAIENGPSGFDPANPAHLQKIRFIMLMRNESLARLDTRFDPKSATLTIWEGGRQVAAGDLSTAQGREEIEAFFAAFMPGELRGAPKVLEAPGFSFSDVARRVVSIINLASVQDLEDRLGKPVDPVRFRGNLLVTGWPAWSELDLVGSELETTTGARLKVVKRIQRCAATNVDPATAARDLNIPQTLMSAFDHMDCGVYAEVIAPGELQTGDDIRVI